MIRSEENICSEQARPKNFSNVNKERRLFYWPIALSVSTLSVSKSNCQWNLPNFVVLT